ncbi:MAG: hypothetical protein QM791_22475 [Ferruginibacter sp.]
MKSDYYPFGMLMPGRKFTNGNEYRYGFNGQEKSDEIFSNSTTALYWEYDSRIGRRWNMDPKPEIGVSEYAVFLNNPLLFTDLNGDKVKLENAGVTKREFRKAKREIRKLRRNSEAFNNMYKDLDADDAVHTFRITKGQGGGEDHSNPNIYNLGFNWKDADDDLKNPMLNRMSHYAHEFGHAWRKFHDLDQKTPDKFNAEQQYFFAPGLFPKKEDIEAAKQKSEAAEERNRKGSNDYNIKLTEVKNSWEYGASHIQNIVLSELQRTNKKVFSSIALRNSYDNAAEAVHMMIAGKLYIKFSDGTGTINLLTAPHDKDFYKNKVDIYEDHKVTPTRKK